jgi:uncharacterized damage-inducible protein DinB
MSASSERAHFALMARYNQWMNEKLYAAAAKLPEGGAHAERGAFFGSLAGTLNHLLLADTIWLQRFAAHPVRYASLDGVRSLPAPAGLADAAPPPLPALWERRQLLDKAIGDWIHELRDEHLDQTLRYRRLNGETYAKRFGSVLQHFFNHQTHHRGQATTLLSQAGIDVGPTDLLLLIDDVA